MLSLLGQRINRVRVMPKRFVDAPTRESGFWAAVGAHRDAATAAGLAGRDRDRRRSLMIPAFQINPSDAQVKNVPARAADAVVGRRRSRARASPDGVFLPHVVLVENGATPAALATDGRGGRARRQGSTAQPLRRVAARASRPRRGVRGPTDGAATAAQDDLAPAERRATRARVAVGDAAE